MAAQAGTQMIVISEKFDIFQLSRISACVARSHIQLQWYLISGALVFLQKPRSKVTRAIWWQCVDSISSICKKNAMKNKNTQPANYYNLIPKTALQGIQCSMRIDSYCIVTSDCFSFSVLPFSLCLFNIYFCFCIYFHTVHFLSHRRYCNH